MNDPRNLKQHREQHVRNFLHMFGPTTVAALRAAIPGNLGGDAVVVARRLIDQGEFSRTILDIDQTSLDET